MRSDATRRGLATLLDDCEPRPPVDLDALLRRHHLSLDRWSFAGGVEELVTVDSIGVADRFAGTVRERELIAHALGHWSLHVAHALIFVGHADWVWLAQQEREAWDFAYHLLVPVDWLFGGQERPVWRIAEACQVTPRFADQAKRLLTLGR